MTAHSRIQLSDAVCEAGSFKERINSLGGHWKDHYGLLICTTVLAIHGLLPLDKYTTAHVEYIFKFQRALVATLGDYFMNGVRALARRACPAILSLR